MEIDLTRFHDMFFEETEEHLNAMETLVVAIDPATVDSETLNAVFRAAHSIKGSAATFGFSAIASFTHHLEAVLDQVRDGRRQLDIDTIDAVLASADCLRQLLALARQGVIDQLPAEAVAVGKTLQAWLDQTEKPALSSSEAGTCISIFPPANQDWGSSVANLLHGSGATILYYPEHPSETEGIVLRLPGDEAAVQDFIDCLAFVLPPNCIRREPDGAMFGLFAQVLPTAPQVEEAWGFFDVEAHLPAAPKADEGWGLFTDESPAPSVTAPAAAAPLAEADSGEGWGLFEPLPVTPATEAVPVAVPDPATPAPAKSVSTPVSSPATREVVAPAAREVAPPAEAATIRIGVDKVDLLLNLVGELVITKAMLIQSAEQLDPALHARLLAGVAQLERNTRELQEAVMAVRMLPVSAVFNRFPRVVREVARKLGKEVELQLVGEQTEIDKGFVEKLTDPLTHLVRNSLDHGIEAPAERLARGKPAQGCLTLRAYHQSGHIVIEVSDDGAGLNRQRILDKARERGMPVTEGMSDGEVFALIFEAGFSTAAVVTDVSGRGVGMDVVRRNIVDMGGRIDIESLPGVGTTMTLRLPLTLAILDGMVVQVGSEMYVLPLALIVESLQPKATAVRSVSGRGRLLQVRGEYLPLLPLHELFTIVPQHPAPEEALCIIVETDGERVALQVDELLGQQQVVVKSLEQNYRRVPGIASATIMGDGHVAFILDVPGLVDIARNQQKSA